MGCRPTSNFLVPHTILPHGPTQLLIMPSVFLLSLLGSRLRRPCNHVSSCSDSPWSGLGVGVSLGENTCAPVVFNSYCNKLNKQVFKETEAEMILLGSCSVGAMIQPVPFVLLTTQYHKWHSRLPNT